MFSCSFRWFLNVLTAFCIYSKYLCLPLKCICCSKTFTVCLTKTKAVMICKGTETFSQESYFNLNTWLMENYICIFRHQPPFVLSCSAPELLGIREESSAFWEAMWGAASGLVGRIEEGNMAVMGPAACHLPSVLWLFYSLPSQLLPLHKPSMVERQCEAGEWLWLELSHS